MRTLGSCRQLHREQLPLPSYPESKSLLSFIRILRHWGKMWRNFQVTNVVLRRSAAPTLFTPSPPPRLAINANMRMCDAAVTSSRRGSIAHMMAMIARYAPSNASFASLAMPYAVDAPNGDHDFQDLVSRKMISSNILSCSIGLIRIPLSHYC